MCIRDRLTSVPTEIPAMMAAAFSFSRSIFSYSGMASATAVSYTHLDVYKRQALQLRNFLRENDPRSCITIVNSSEIIGKGFRSFN